MPKKPTADPDGTAVDADVEDTAVAEVEAAPAPDEPTDPLGRPVAAEFPVGVLVGEGVERTWIGEFEYAVDPETGKVTGRA